MRPHDPVRVALLGFGRVARRFHGPILAGLPGVALVAVAEENESAHEVCRECAPGAALYRDYTDLLNDCTVDAAVICLPPHLHFVSARACLSQGLHLYLEKPLSTRIADGEELVQAWRSAGTAGWIGFNYRFHPLVRQMRDAVAAGVVGKPVGVQAVFSSARRELPTWKQSLGDGGGVLLDLDSHHVDLLRFILQQDVSAVTAMVESNSTQADTSVTQLHLTEGTLASVFSSLAAVERHSIEVVGDAGQIAFDRYRSRQLRFSSARRDFGAKARLLRFLAECARLPATARDTLWPPTEHTYALALESFIEAVRGSPVSGPDLQDGLASLEVIDAAARSASTGARVRLTAPDA